MRQRLKLHIASMANNLLDLSFTGQLREDHQSSRWLYQLLHNCGFENEATAIGIEVRSHRCLATRVRASEWDPPFGPCSSPSTRRQARVA